MQNPLSTMIEIDEFHYQKDDIVTAHASIWGDFNFSLNGLIEYNIEQKRFLSPPNYGIWIPPQTVHCSTAIAEHSTHYICIRIHPNLCHLLPETCSTLSILPFFRQTISELLRLKQQQQMATDYYHHLLQILFDQLTLAPIHQQYLPQSDHPRLNPILKALSDPERFQQSLQQVLAEFSLSERHILRLSQQQLQLPLSEWRNRVKIVFSIHQLQQGIAIKRIAYQLGFQHSSSFIHFFKQRTGQTPAQLRDIQE